MQLPVTSLAERYTSGADCLARPQQLNSSYETTEDRLEVRGIHQWAISHSIRHKTEKWLENGTIIAAMLS